MFAAGIDVSSTKLDVALVGGEEPWRGSFENSVAGRKALVKALRKRAKKAQLRCAVEPTGSYHVGCLTELHKAKIPVMLVNPRWSSHMAAAIGQRGKTDAADALMLARYAAHDSFKAWQPPQEGEARLRELVRRRAQHVQARTKDKNRIKELMATGLGGSVIEDLEETIKFLDERIALLEAAIKALVASDSELKAKVALLKSQPGIGDTIAAIVVAELAYMPKDLTSKQLVAMVGLDPVPKQSGKMKGRMSISKRGNKHLRTAMFLAAWGATKSSPHARAWREALLERGKAKKVATTALARRLLVATATILRTKTPWDGERFHPLSGKTP